MLPFVAVRQAGTCDPLLQRCWACTWIHLSSSNKIQTNCMGLKVTACMFSWGKLRTKDTKKPENPTATFEEPGAKAKGRQQRQGTAHAPCAHHHKGMGKPPKPPLQPDPWTHPYPHPHIRNKLALPRPEREQATETVTCSRSSLLQHGPQ